MPRLLDNSVFATVGIAQLTTSRQGGAPALTADLAGNGWRLTGLVPWCTGAAFASQVILRSVEGTADQLLCAVPTDLPGLHIEPALPLVALRSTHTTSIRLHDVLIGSGNIIKGPRRGVLSGRKHVLPAGQAFLAWGSAARGPLDRQSRFGHCPGVV